MTPHLIYELSQYVAKHGPLNVIKCMRMIFETAEPDKPQFPEMIATWENTVRPGFVKMLQEAEKECERLYEIGLPENN